jgi:hypothetical protein
MTDFGLWIAYILFIVCIVSLIVLPLKTLLQNPQATKKTGIGLGLLLALFLLSYLLSGGQANEKFDVSAGQSKLIGAGLTLLYLLAIATLGLTVYSEFFKFFKKRT